MMEHGAVISEDECYRYELWRRWTHSSSPLTFVMLNPSTADASKDDPTIRRCISFATDHGYGGIIVQNLYAYRTSKPTELWAAEKRGVDIIGPMDRSFLQTQFRRTCVCAWGAGAPADRVEIVLRLLTENDGVLVHLGLTKNGNPKHPLYIPASQPFLPFTYEYPA